MLRARRGRRRPGGAHDTEERQDAERSARAPGVRDDERHVPSDEAEVVRRVADARSVARCGDVAYRRPHGRRHPVFGSRRPRAFLHRFQQAHARAAAKSLPRRRRRARARGSFALCYSTTGSSPRRRCDDAEVAAIACTMAKTFEDLDMNDDEAMARWMEAQYGREARSNDSVPAAAAQAPAPATPQREPPAPEGLETGRADVRDVGAVGGADVQADARADAEGRGVPARRGARDRRRRRGRLGRGCSPSVSSQTKLINSLGRTSHIYVMLEAWSGSIPFSSGAESLVKTLSDFDHILYELKGASMMSNNHRGPY